jgi:hypothetical protein
MKLSLPSTGTSSTAQPDKPPNDYSYYVAEMKWWEENDDHFRERVKDTIAQREEN